MSVRVAVAKSLRLLPVRDRRLLGLAAIIQMSSSALDLVGVLLIGIVGAMAVTTIQSHPPPGFVENVAAAFGLQALSSQQLVAVFACAAAVLLLVKSAISSLMTRRVFIFLANRQAIVSARLAGTLFRQPLEFVQRRPTQETSFALINGAGAATMQILGFTVIALSEIALLLVIGAALIIISPWVALGAILFFSGVGVLMQRLLGNWASRLGTAAARADVASLDAVRETIAAFREITVTNKQGRYAHRFEELRWAAARATAEIQFIGLLPKYVYDTAMIVGGFVLAGVLLVTQDAETAIGTLALFLAAGTRVMPSLLRLQSATLGLRSASGIASITYSLASDLAEAERDPQAKSDTTPGIRKEGQPQWTPSLSLRNVSFKYRDRSTWAVHDVTFNVKPGTSLAVIGASGSGKSTLADLILGMNEPQTGEILLGGLAPRRVIRDNPGRLGYVPQEVPLVNATLRRNVALGLEDQDIDDEQVRISLDTAHLSKFVDELPDGLNTYLGEGGVRLSGGQRQRLGIARALYSNPQILILDEATSSLDAESEQVITEAVESLAGQMTRIVIAHRLATVRSVDKVVYLENGEIVGEGTFDEVRNAVPALLRQANLLGLD